MLSTVDVNSANMPDQLRNAMDLQPYVRVMVEDVKRGKLAELYHLPLRCVTTADVARTRDGGTPYAGRYPY